MATTVRETERKYEAGGAGLDLGALVERLAAAANGVAPAVPVTMSLSAVYYDTADLRLARAGLTLRRRRGGDDAGWHLKLPAGTDSRDEVRLPLGRSTRPPAHLVGLTRASHRGAGLAPVAQLDNRRRRWVLTDSEGRTLAEVVDDQVTATTPDGAPPTSWDEIEVELADGADPAVLDRIEAELLAAGAARSASSSKLGRVLADRMPLAPGPPRAGPKATAGEAVLAYLGRQAEAIRRTDPAVRRELPDAVHQMRVACRRLRSALQAFAPLFDPERVAGLTDELRWLAGELGAARDLEVLEGRLDSAVARLPSELVLGPVSARLTRYFAPRRAEAAAAATAALDSDRYLVLLDRIDQLQADPPLTRRAARPARTELPARVRRSLRRAERALREAAVQPPGEERDTALHTLRKAAKRLRYAAEASVPVVGKRASRFVDEVKGVQELLGERQDSAVARSVLRQLGAAAHTGRENGFTYGLLYRDEVARSERAEAGLDDAWAALRKRAGWADG
ncbi:CYTH and CHAD domain-containing protein [Pseudonocardia bannensis]|uniref:CYTH and CHAD domain-containing protein n=1 Tax=Pseudonocardia bannensis TaxID=630973 RepID=A0A848DMY5_9PSEU|nr:CYTH and CHAD domain-containing protein [Pseudonocardia bannensis]NMH94058.1 CYTH and CHAD domain-containing protein [Pseudonocardia bannensis]